MAFKRYIIPVDTIHGFAKIMFVWHPKSFSALILAGYLFASLPLIFSLIYSATAINQLSTQNRQVVYKAERIAHFSRILVNHAASMERSVKLTSILEDKSLLKKYFQSHDEFRDILQNLSSLPLTDKQRQLIQIIESSESAIFHDVTKILDARKHIVQRHVDFSTLIVATQDFLNHGDAPIEREVEAMQKMADQANRIIMLLLAGLVPFVTLLAFGFSVLITRPIRQIDNAIRSMGNGNLSSPVEINGPQDLQQLANRLNWMRQRLMEIEDQKSTFLQHVSHELKTPLTSIREGANLLCEGVAGKLTERQSEITKILYSNSLHLQKRIEDLLNFSALQSAKAILIRQNVALKPLLDLIVHDQYLAMTNKSLKIELLCPDLSIECDQQKLGIIMDNLLSNAIKYSPVGGQIKIRVKEINDTIRLDVIDSGPGIDPTDRERIFDAFYQGRKAPQSHIRGTGLGLAIAREYALAHSGTLELTELEAGTCFRLALPATRMVVTA